LPGKTGLLIYSLKWQLFSQFDSLYRQSSSQRPEKKVAGTTKVAAKHKVIKRAVACLAVLSMQITRQLSRQTDAILVLDLAFVTAWNELGEIHNP